jgi:hypothetical protein
MAKERKLDIFNVLSHIDKKDYNWFASLPIEEQKEFAPVVAQRWLSGTNDALQIVLINELVNKFTFSCGGHKDLLYRLMCCTTNGSTKRYQWTKSKSNKSSKPISTKVVQQYYTCSSQHAYENLELLTKDQVAAMAMDLGYEKADITKIKREMK